MNLTDEDLQVIAAYMRAERPGYKGPIFIPTLSNLSQQHMRSAASHVHYALLFASGKLFSGKRAAS